MAVWDGLDLEAGLAVFERKVCERGSTGHKHLPVAPWDVGAKQQVCNYQVTNVRQPQGQIRRPCKSPGSRARKPPVRAAGVILVKCSLSKRVKCVLPSCLLSALPSHHMEVVLTELLRCKWLSVVTETVK